MSIYIENESRVVFDFKDRDRVIRKVIRTVMEAKHIPMELDVNVLLTVPSAIKTINREMRGIDSVTDVLSFPYFEFQSPGVFANPQAGASCGAETEGEDILGDIVLCASKVKEQAKKYGHSQKRELAFLIVHSMLHLIGYDHMEPEDAALMQQEEKQFMELLHINR